MAESLQDKKMDYSFESKNFTIDGELTVTITLNEYRELVASKATKEAAIRKAEEDKWKRNDENNRLTEENAKLKAELYELKKKMEETAQPKCKTDKDGQVDYEEGDGDY